MASLYARRLVERGYTAFAFDFSGFGESQGAPRQTEMPARKIDDIIAAAKFLRTLACVDPERVGAVAICASAQYTLAALASGAGLRSWASVAGWFHDPASVAGFYGGESGVAERLSRARAAVERYVSTGELGLVPAYAPGDERAGMSFELDYYGSAERGALPAWKNEMSELTWLYWLGFDGLRWAAQVSTPSLFVHSDGCVFPEHVRRVHAAVRGPKRLAWGDGGQIDYYDQPSAVGRAIDAIAGWFDETLRP
jgi:hypothetical protein